MYPLHDKDLDRLSREAAEQFEVEPGTSGWERLEKRLDQELPQKKDRRRFLFWLFFISITTGGALTVILKNNMPAGNLATNTIKVASSPKANEPVNNTVTPEQTIANPSTKNNNNLNNHTNPAAPTTVNTQPVAGNNPVTNKTLPDAAGASKQPATATIHQPPTIIGNVGDNNVGNNKTIQQGDKSTGNKKVKAKSPKPVIDKEPLSLNYAAIAPPGNRVNNKPTQLKQRNHKRGQPQRTTVPDNAIAANDRTSDQVTNEPVDNSNEPSSLTKPTDAKPADAANTGAVTDNKTTAPAATDSNATPVQQPVKKEKDTKKNNAEKGLWEFGVMAGPDYTAVNFGPLYDVGYNFGLQVSYRFSDRWSVNTGIIYTKKFYKADSQYYHPKYPLPPNRTLEGVKGNCSMWEIPVNVRYDVAYNDKRRWFVSTGLSTYLMDKENYLLHVGYGGGYYDHPINSDTNSEYLFSIVNLSAGFERSLGKHFSIQAEPYLKVPMKGLGLGSMRMDSYGVLFTLKYKPIFRSKQSDKNKK